MNRLETLKLGCGKDKFKGDLVCGKKYWMNTKFIFTFCPECSARIYELERRNKEILDVLNRWFSERKHIKNNIVIYKILEFEFPELMRELGLSEVRHE